MSAGQAPVVKIECFPLKIAVWANNFEGRVSYSTKLQKTYKDKQTNEWKETDSLMPSDLPVAALLLNKAFDRIIELRAAPQGAQPQTPAPY